MRIEDKKFGTRARSNKTKIRKKYDDFKAILKSKWKHSRRKIIKN